jgi:hypothetical protein
MFMQGSVQGLELMGFEIECFQAEKQAEKQPVGIYSTVRAEFYSNEVAHKLHYHFMLIGAFGRT